MKKATAVLLISVWSLSLSARAENNPVLMLPGMRPADQVMPPAAVVSTLPQPVISDLINYPNPFDSRKSGLEGQTELAYQLAGDFKTTVTLYDLTGVRVRHWDFRPGDNGARSGSNTVRWDGTNEAGQKVSKGGYLAMIEVETPRTVATALRKIAVIH